jgi:hypothetical protein
LEQLVKKTVLRITVICLKVLAELIKKYPQTFNKENDLNQYYRFYQLEVKGVGKYS